MSDIFAALKAEFPRQAISWRAQSVTKDGTKAMALAYIDARDVMNRLDEVCGPSGWQDRYEFHGARTVCYLSVRDQMGDWITKADGAGDTDVEAEKGGISDAFKRAAVKWGIGRYLYDLDAPWVACESYDGTRNGKPVKLWKRWIGDPWASIKSPPSAPPPGRSAPPPEDGTSNDGGASLSEPAKAFIFAAGRAKSADELKAWMDDVDPELSKLHVNEVAAVKDHARAVWRALSQKEAA